MFANRGHELGKLANLIAHLDTESRCASELQREWMPMPYLLNAFYLLGVVVLSPWLLYKAITTGKYRRGLRAKFFGMHIPVTPSPLHPFGSGAAPVAWFHGVSVGEIHLLRQVVARFRREHPHWE